MTRTDVAYAAKRSEQSVWLWERGKVTPPLQVIGEIANALGCEVDDLFEDNGDA